jgi:methyl-accepting chemotaxis protein/sigma-B regulation protein RsbU (phosphoserine phosphatase)
MKKLLKSVFSPPSLRVDLIVICGVVLLLIVSLSVMFYFSRKAVQREASLYAEQTLEGTSRHIDNALLSVEQSTTNIYCELLNHLDQPERMERYCRHLVECNPYITGAVICFKPGYLSGKDKFMSYVHYRGGVKKSDNAASIVTSDKYGNKPYTEYSWYTEPMSTGKACWTDPLPEEEDEGVTVSYCQPIVDRHQEVVGVVVSDISVNQLSEMMLADNTTSNRYSVLLGSDGSYIVHPDQQKRVSETVFTQSENGENPMLLRIAKAMMTGETGYEFFEMDGKDWYVFYKPFVQTEVPNRTRGTLNWSVGIVYSESDIFGSYNYLLLIVVMIAVLGLSLFFLLARLVSRRQMKAIRQLTNATQQVADGHYDAPMPDINRKDEIGQLYSHFQVMKQSLATHVSELRQLTTTLKKRREVMHEVYAKEQSVDRMKTSFLHYVTNQMVAPSLEILRCAKILQEKYHELSPREVGYVVDTINKKIDTIVEQLDNMLDVAEKEAGKEVGHE